MKSLKAGMPLVIYPEGGRTPDGEIKPFLPGAFFLAIKAQVDIVPVALVGTYELLPMNTYHIKCRPLEMRVGEPISTAGLTMRDMEAVSAKVKKAMEELYYAKSISTEHRPSSLSTAQAEIHLDFRFHLNRITHPQIRLVAPLLHRADAA